MLFMAYPHFYLFGARYYGASIKITYGLASVMAEWRWHSTTFLFPLGFFHDGMKWLSLAALDRQFSFLATRFFHIIRKYFKYEYNHQKSAHQLEWSQVGKRLSHPSHPLYGLSVLHSPVERHCSPHPSCGI